MTRGAELRLSLADAQARAVAASHRLAEARAAGGDGGGGRGRCVKRPNRPIGGLGAGYTRTNHVVELLFQDLAASRASCIRMRRKLPDETDLQWPIYNGGRTDALERAARADASAAAADVAAAQADLRVEVARAFGRF